MTTALSAIQCAPCGTWHDPARRHRCPRLDPRELPDVVAEPAHVPLAPTDARPVVAVVLRWDAARDLERLAPHVPRIYGRGVGCEPSVRGTGPAVLPSDGLSARDRAEVHAIHVRLESLRTGEGCKHYKVLWYTFLETAAEQRYTQGALAKHSHGALSETFLVALGRHFAAPAQRAKWAKLPQVALRTALPRKLARQLYDAAVAAYEGT